MIRHKLALHQDTLTAGWDGATLSMFPACNAGLLCHCPTAATTTGDHCGTYATRAVLVWSLNLLVLGCSMW